MSDGMYGEDEVPRNLAHRQRKKDSKKLAGKSDDELMLEVTEELMSNRDPLDFASYQREVGKQTPIWPIDNPDYVMEKIKVLASNAIGTDKHTLAIQSALILRSITEICDYIPMPLERLANISLMQMPSDQKKLE